MEKEKETLEVSEEKKVKMPNVNPYNKVREEDDPETDPVPAQPHPAGDVGRRSRLQGPAHPGPALPVLRPRGQEAAADEHPVAGRGRGRQF